MERYYVCPDCKKVLPAWDAHLKCPNKHSEGHQLNNNIQRISPQFNYGSNSSMGGGIQCGGAGGGVGRKISSTPGLVNQSGTVNQRLKNSGGKPAMPDAFGRNITVSNIGGGKRMLPSIGERKIKLPSIGERKITAPNIIGGKIAVPNLISGKITVPNMIERKTPMPNMIGRKIKVPNMIRGKITVPSINQRTIANTTTHKTPKQGLGPSVHSRSKPESTAHFSSKGKAVTESIKKPGVGKTAANGSKAVYPKRHGTTGFPVRSPAVQLSGVASWLHHVKSSYRRTLNGSLPIPMLPPMVPLGLGFPWTQAQGSPSFLPQLRTTPAFQQQRTNNNNQQFPTHRTMGIGAKLPTVGAVGVTKKRTKTDFVKLPIKRGRGIMNHDSPYGRKAILPSSSINTRQGTPVNVTERTWGHELKHSLAYETSVKISDEIKERMQSFMKTSGLGDEHTNSGAPAVFPNVQRTNAAHTVVLSDPKVPTLRQSSSCKVIPPIINERYEGENHRPTPSESTGTRRASIACTQQQTPDPRARVSPFSDRSDLEDMETQRVEVEDVQAEVKVEVEQEDEEEVGVEVMHDDDKEEEVRVEVEQEEEEGGEVKVEEDVHAEVKVEVEQEDEEEVRVEVEQEEVRVEVKQENETEPVGQEELDGELETRLATIKSESASLPPPIKSEEGEEGGKAIPGRKYVKRFLLLPPMKKLKLAPNPPKKPPTLKRVSYNSSANGTISESKVFSATDSAASSNQGGIVKSEKTSIPTRTSLRLNPVQVSTEKDEKCQNSCNGKRSKFAPGAKTPSKPLVERSCKKSASVTTRAATGRGGRVCRKSTRAATAAKPQPTHKRAKGKKGRKKVGLRKLKLYVPSMPGTDYKLPDLNARGTCSTRYGKRWVCLVCEMEEPNNSSKAMISCDQYECKDWYHLDCVGISENMPKEDPWYCLRCVYKSAAHPTIHFPTLFKLKN